ncbi:MAG: nucleotidyltransferase family protein [Bacteroidota bacterium]
MKILILAAGSSSRLGRPKQLLQYEGESLLRRSVKSALKTGIDVCVVTGSNHEDHENEIDDLNVDIVYNSTWNQGMGNSLKIGVTYLLDQNPDLDAVIIMVCDQPKLTTSILQDLISKYEEGNTLVASQYSDTNGVPALFHKTYFDEMLDIKDQQGAKVLINTYPVCPVPFSSGIEDIDTMEDYNRLIEGSHS